MPRSKSTKNARKPRAKRAAKPTFDKRVKAVISRMAKKSRIIEEPLVLGRRLRRAGTLP